MIKENILQKEHAIQISVIITFSTFLMFLYLIIKRYLEFMKLIVFTFYFFIGKKNKYLGFEAH